MAFFGVRRTDARLASRWIWALFAILVAGLCRELVLVHDALLRRQEEIARLRGWEVGAGLESMRALLLFYGMGALALGAAVFPAGRLVSLWRQGPTRGVAANLDQEECCRAVEALACHRSGDGFTA